MKKETEKQIHPLPPFYRADSRILILGSFPSVKSREQHFFYGHPQNRFWSVTAAVFGCSTPHTVEEKKLFLESNQIALWDVIASCEIKGSSDSSIQNAVPNDLGIILEHCTIHKIFIMVRRQSDYIGNISFRRQEGRSFVCLPRARQTLLGRSPA